jgi:hypothetical protein
MHTYYLFAIYFELFKIHTRLADERHQKRGHGFI